MEKIWLTIINHKGNPLSWPFLALLWLVSIFYRLGLHWHEAGIAAAVKTGVPLISVGNLTVGGSGKTPLVIELARYFLGRGYRTGIVSSGYGRESREDVIGSGIEIQKMKFEAIGDEVLMMAECLPEAFFAVSVSKSQAAKSLDDKFGPQIIIIDDGFQHRKLHRDCNLLLIDAARDLRREYLFPLGRLREPLKAMNRADWIILTKANSRVKNEDFCRWTDTIIPGKKAVKIEYLNENLISGSDRIELKEVSDRRIYFFAGVGSFDLLEKFMAECFSDILEIRQFPDHCRYGSSDQDRIKKDIALYRPDYVVTTYKDYVKVRDFDFGRRIYYLDLRLRFDTADEDFFGQLESTIRR
jgi:tetraacyldisaccharide 4'-kinase